MTHPAPVKQAATEQPRAVPTAADLQEMLPKAKPRSAPKPFHSRRGEIMLYRFLVLTAVIGFWEVGATNEWIDSFFWSQPTEIFATGIAAFQSGMIIDNTLFTFTSTIAGFVLGVGGGVGIGLLFWWSNRLALTSEPLLVTVEAMPKLALAPIVVLAFGLGIASKIAMATLLVIVIQALNTYTAVKAVDQDQVTLLRSLGASEWQVFSRVVVPSVLPAVGASLRISIGLALSGAIVGEYIGSTMGLGRMIQYAGMTYEIDLIWVGIFMLMVLAMILYAGVSLLERLFPSSNR
jgi:NitT/TauT family transport system permease protein